MRARARAFVAIVAAVPLLAACGGDDTASTGSTAIPETTEGSSTDSRTDPRTPLVVDTDLSADDIVALTYLTSRDDVDLLAVTVSATGEVRCPRGADGARGLLARIGRGDVPVACGSTAPGWETRTFPEPWRDAADNANGLLLEVVTPPADQPSAAELLASSIVNSPEPVVVLTLGPLTNVSEALTARPEMAGSIDRIVTMGGAIDVPGNVIPDGASAPIPVEWNLFVDPSSADSVVQSGVPMTLVALDATNQVPLDDDLIKRLAANNTTDATDRVLHLFEEFPPPYLWDTLAAIAVTDPALVPTHAATISVLTEGDEAGRTVARADGAAVDVAEVPDAGAVIDQLLRTLANVPADEPLVTPTTLPILGSFEIRFEGGQCTFDGPTELQAGRYQFSSTPGDVAYWVAVAHFVGDATGQDAIDWVMQHPEEDDPPMVGDVAPIGEDGESSTDVVLAAGNAGVVCFTENNTIDLAADLVVTG